MKRHYATCLRIAREHYENFPVASRLVPADLRPHIAAIYAFARGADDIADEPGRTPDERLALLDEWSRAPAAAAARRCLRGAGGDARAVRSAAGAVRRSAERVPAGCGHDPLRALGRRARLLPPLGQPIGRLVLRLARRADAEADRQSDAVCTALQLTNFWQDLAVDWAPRPTCTCRARDLGAAPRRPRRSRSADHVAGVAACARVGARS